MKMSRRQLPFDIQVQIIERLPIKSLIRFRSVCKAWKSFIGSSHFIAAYNLRQHQPEHLLVRYAVGGGEEPEVSYVSFVDYDDDTFPQQKFALTVPPLVQRTTLLDSSHGLLCLIGSIREPGDLCRKKTAVLWNPAIRKSVAVVVPNVAHPHRAGHLVGYRPFRSIVGFGVCPDTKDPKLVNITYPDDCLSLCRVMVFTLSSGEWRISCSNELLHNLLEFVNRCQTVIGRFIYWVAYDGHFLILSFDLSTDEFREVHLPEHMRKSESDLFISRLRESLVLLDYNINFTTTAARNVCDVWMMEHGDQKVFTKLFTIKLPDASVALTLGFRNNGEPIIGMRDDDEDSFSECALVVYKPCLEHIKDLGIHGLEDSFFASSYTESLLLLDHTDGHIVKSGAIKS